MSQDDDITKGDNIAVDVPVSNSVNNIVSNEVNKVATAMSNGQNTSFNEVNNVILQKPTHKPKIREQLVSKATAFLTSTSIKSSPMEKTVYFLLNKGLTYDEIRESFNRAGLFAQNQNPYVPTPPSGYNNLSNTSGVIQTPNESQSWFRWRFWPFIAVATVAYIGYQAYKKYIVSWLFRKQKSPLEVRLERIESIVQNCVIILEKNIMNTSESSNESSNRSRDIGELRSELKSIKSLLLNRYQFPPAPISPSLPQWQLPKNTKPQAELQNKVNGSDTQNVSQKSIVNGTDNTLTHFPGITNVGSTSTADDDQLKSNDSTPNGCNDDANLKNVEQ